MSQALLLLVLAAASVVGCAVFFRLELFACVYLACAACSLVNAIQLARRASPSFWRGQTSTGQALVSAGCLAQGVLCFVKDVPSWLGHALAALGCAAFVCGLLIEARARREQVLPGSG